MGWFRRLLTLPALLVSITREPPPQALHTVIREGGPAEKDAYAAGGYSRRVEAYVNCILGGLGIRGQEAEHIRVAARLHDLGTVHVSSDLHGKTVALTADDYTQIQDYPEHGARLLAAYPDLSRVLQMVRHHHEAWDGSGYPAGLAGTNIPFGSRVLAVADSFDAMTSDRPYRSGMSVERASAILQDGRGQQWDPEVVDALLSVVRERSYPLSFDPAGTNLASVSQAG